MTWGRLLRRRLGLDGNPVRRGTDRAEAWARIGLVVLFLIAAPVTAVVLAHWTATIMTREASTQAGAEHLVPATLLDSAPPVGRFPGAGSGFSSVPARWTGPGSGPRTGRVEVPDGTREGGTIKVWAGPGGRLANPPLTHAQIVSRVVTVAALAPAGVGLVALTAAGVIHQLLERRRLAAWAAAWAAVEPQWTRRLR
jgi:hypothetical protein